MRFACLLVLLLAASSALAQGTCTNGSATLNGVTYECDGIDVLANIPVGIEGPFRTGALNDIWGWTDPQDNSEYALVGTRSGTVFVDVTSPTAPRVLGKLITPSDPRTWRDVKVIQNHAYVGSEAPGHGVQVFDLTRLRGLSEDASRDFQPDALYEGVSSSHNIVVNEATEMVYAVGAISVGATLPASCNAKGFHAIDVSTPTTPTFAGCFSDVANETGPRTPGYTHDAQCVIYNGPDADYQGKELCFAANEDVVSVFDVTNLNAVTLITQIAYPNESYTHQGWLTEDQRYFIANDELDEQRDRSDGKTPNQRTLVFDVEDLDNPDFAFQYDSGLTTIDHNNYTLDRFLFQANYEAGLRVLDLADIENGTLTEIGFFDTYPQATTAEFNGMWSVYPYFASGVLIASDSNNGLFVLRPDATLLADADTALEADFALTAPQPNPATGRTMLSLQVRESQTVSARLYDLTGRELATVFEGTFSSGRARQLTVDASALPTGVYVVRVTGETFSTSERLTVVR